MSGARSLAGDIGDRWCAALIAHNAIRQRLLSSGAGAVVLGRSLPSSWSAISGLHAANRAAMTRERTGCEIGGMRRKLQSGDAGGNPHSTFGGATSTELPQSEQRNAREFPRRGIGRSTIVHRHPGAEQLIDILKSVLSAQDSAIFIERRGALAKSILTEIGSILGSLPPDGVDPNFETAT